MVQGLPAVDWKSTDNNTKLFAAVLTLFPGTPDNKKIAAVFGESTSNPAISIVPRPWRQSINFFCIGPNVPASAISYRLNVIRKDGAALGVKSGTSSFSAPARTNGTTKRATPATKRAAPATKQNKLKGNGRKLGGMMSDDTR